jgi:hypothetical protein
MRKGEGERERNEEKEENEKEKRRERKETSFGIVHYLRSHCWCEKRHKKEVLKRLS